MDHALNLHLGVPLEVFDAEAVKVAQRRDRVREGEASRIQLLPGEAGDVNLLLATLGHPVRPQNRSFRRCQEDL